MDAESAEQAATDESLPASRSAVHKALTATVAGAPLHAWLQLLVAVAAVSTAASAFLLARDVQPGLLAAWRLTLVTVLLAPAAYSQWRAGDAALRERWADDAHLMAAAGVTLGGHFFFWVASTQRTALTHSLLLVSATPLLLAAWALLRRKPLSRGELVGTVASLLGGALLVADARSDKSVSLFGDLCAFAAAAFFGIYLTIGQGCRAWCPLFLYVLVVNACAALTLTACAVLLEGASFFGAGKAGIFGWLTVPRYASLTVYLAVVPGIIGHISFNAVLRHISPLVITVALTTEPLFGTLLGAALGVASPPRLFAYLGGVVLMGSTLLVVYSEGKRKEKEKEASAAVTLASGTYDGMNPGEL
jgi:drug/metabolite transporter (DMT)-like permease